MDHLKRPIEIEILGLKKSNKPTNSTLCGWQVCYVLGIFFMGWGNKIWLAPKLVALLPKTTARLPLIPPAGCNWIKMVSTEKIIKNKNYCNCWQDK